MKIGGPAGIQGMVFSLSNVIIQGAVNGFGSAVIAGSSAAQNFEFISYFIINSFCQAAATFTSQNYGARNKARCRKIFKLSMLCAFTASISVCMMSLLFRYSLIRLFSTNPDVIEYGVTRMLHVLTFACIVSSYEIGGAALRGMAYSMTPAVLTIMGSCLLRILWVATVFQKWHTFESLILIYPISWIITGTSVLIAYFLIRKHAFTKLPDSVL